MKLFRSLGAVLALAGLALATPAAADNISITSTQPVITHMAVADATANYTNATTSATDIAAASITVPATKKAITGNTSSPSGVVQYLRVCYWADVSKATGGTGSIKLLISGSAVAAAQRTTAVVGATSLSACYVKARATTSSIVVKLQGVSSDTSTFTVANATMSVEVLYFS